VIQVKAWIRPVKTGSGSWFPVLCPLRNQCDPGKGMDQAAGSCPFDLSGTDVIQGKDWIRLVNILHTQVNNLPFQEPA